MSDLLTPAPGFDWLKVRWSRTAEDVCSYCKAAIGEDEVPLRLFRGPHGELGAVFCKACMKRWWGMESFDEDDDA
jgi:hypothetical protein